MQNSDSTFRRWMQVLIVFSILFISYVVIADRYVPLTTESRVQSHVIQLVPEVSGTVKSVYIKNNQQVNQGQLLFAIDDRKYQLAYKTAEVNLLQAKEQELALFARAKAAKAKVDTANAVYLNASHEYERVSQLANRNLVSKSKLDRALADIDTSRANLHVTKNELLALQSQLGNEPGESSVILSAENRLQQAKLALSHTKVVAPSAGVISNLQLEVGSYANVSKPLLTLIPTQSMWVAADFREKAVALVDEQSTALVAFDAFPGETYSLDLQSRDLGVSNAQQAPSGKLAFVETNNRWVRNAQRIRINLTYNKTLPKQLFVGSRATVVLYPQDNVIWSWFAKVQINLVSLLHYIY